MKEEQNDLIVTVRSDGNAPGEGKISSLPSLQEDFDKINTFSMQNVDARWELINTNQ